MSRPLCQERHNRQSSIGATNGHFGHTEPTWGFYGAFSHHATTDSSVAWPLASEAIAKETGCTAEDVRRFLDSTKGRLFAEGVIEELKSTNALKTAIDAAVTKLRRHKIRSEDGSDGLPYLKAFACDCKLDAETSEG